MKEGDLFIAINGSGKIGHIDYLLDQAGQTGARRLVVTGAPGERTPREAERVLFLPACVYKGTDPRVVKSIQPMLHDIHDDVGTLSGGNQQKCVLAKWLALDLKVLILNGPTVGVDIGAKFDIYELVKRLAKQGLTVIIISDDLPEVLTNCNRVMVMPAPSLSRGAFYSRGFLYTVTP